MISFDRSQTVSVSEVDLMCRISDHGRPMHLKGHDLRRARRIVEFEFLEPGHLSDRYFGLTSKGRDFVAGYRRQSETHP